MTQPAQMPLPAGPRDMLDRLATEHRAIIGFVHQLIQSGDYRERGSIVAELIDTLAIHVKIALAQLALVSPRDAAFVPMLQRLQGSLADHFNREEHQAFPLVRRTAGAHYGRYNALSDRLRSHWNYAPI